MIIAAALASCAAFAQNYRQYAKFGDFSLIEKGVLEYNSRFIMTDVSGDTHMRALKSFKIEKDENSATVTGKFAVSPKKASKQIDEGGNYYTSAALKAKRASYDFTQKIEKIKDGVKASFSLSGSSAIDGKPLVAINSLAQLYAGRIWVDGEPLKNITGKKQFFTAKQIRIVSPDKVLEVSGNLSCSVHKPKSSPPLIRISIYYEKKSPNLAELSFELKCIKTFAAAANIESLAKPIDLPLPEGSKNFVCVPYKILKGAALRLKSGETAEIGGTGAMPAYLEILNAFTETGSGKLGRVRVEYTTGKPDVFEIGAGETGALGFAGAPENATVAWRSEIGGKKVALYTTELQLRKKRVKSLAFTNLGSGEWIIPAATFSRNKIGAIENDETYITQSDLFQPIVFKRPALKGSALDMSWMLDAPAGKHGRVKVVGGKFVFEKTGKPARFYGANTCGTASVPSHEEAEALAEQFARMGFNVLRIHHYDRLVATSKNGDSAELDPVAMDKFDYLFNEMKKRGIYITTDFYTTRRLLRSEYDDIKYEGENMKLVFAASEKAVDNFNRFVKNILTHVNPYTGLAYKDDPALFSVVVRNESSYIGTQNFVVRTPADREAMQPKYEKWLAANGAKWKGRPENELYQLFLLDAYEHTHGRMMEQIRALAPELLVSDQNHWDGFMVKAMSKTYDFTSKNRYFGHPIYLEYRLNLPSFIRSDSPLESFNSTTVAAFDAQMFDKPLIITEWNFVARPYSAQGPFLTGAYAALNEVGGLCYFAFSHVHTSILKNPGLGGFDFASNPAVSLAHRAGVLLYGRGDIAPASSSFPILVSEEYFRNGCVHAFASSFAGYTRLALVGRIGYAPLAPKAGSDVPLPKNASAVLFAESGWKNTPFGNLPKFDLNKCAKNLITDKTTIMSSLLSEPNFKIGKGSIDLENMRFKSSTGQLFADLKNKLWKAVSPRSEAFILEEGAELAGDFVSAKSRKGGASVLVSAIDGKDLKESRRILILHITSVFNSQEKFFNSEMNIMLDRGHPIKIAPTLARAGETEMSVNSPLKGYKLYALDTDGSRLFEVPIEQSGEGSAFRLSVHNKKGSVFAYELVK